MPVYSDTKKEPTHDGTQPTHHLQMSLRRRILLHSISSSSKDPDHSSSPPHSRQIPSNLIIGVVSAAAACLFLAIIYYFVLRHRRRRPILVPSAPGNFASTLHHPIDYPTWQVRTVGLDDVAISSLGSYPHRPTSGDLAADCPVCLGEILEGELVRLLPKCRHVFHVPCIDTWLRCHVTCPLCRAPAVDGGDDVDSSPQLGATEQAEEGEGGSEAAEVRVSVEVPGESSRVLTSESVDEEVLVAVGEEEKEGNCSCSSSKDEGLEKGQSEIGSGRGFLFSRLGRAKSSSTCSLTT